MEPLSPAKTRHSRLLTVFLSTYSLYLGHVVANPLHISLLLHRSGSKFYANGIIPTIKKYIKESNYGSILNGTLISLVRLYAEFLSRIQLQRLFEYFFPLNSRNMTSFFNTYIKYTSIQLPVLMLTFPLDILYIKRAQTFREKNGGFSALSNIIKKDGFKFICKGILFEIFHRTSISTFSYLLHPFTISLSKKLPVSLAFSKLLNQFICLSITYPMETLKIRYLASSDYLDEDIQSTYDRKKSIIHNFLYTPFLELYDGYMTFAYYYITRVISTRIFSKLLVALKKMYDLNDTEKKEVSTVQNLLKDTSDKRHMWSTRYSHPLVGHDHRNNFER